MRNSSHILQFVYQFQPLPNLQLPSLTSGLWLPSLTSSYHLWHLPPLANLQLPLPTTVTTRKFLKKFDINNNHFDNITNQPNIKTLFFLGHFKYRCVLILRNFHQVGLNENKIFKKL